MTRYRVVCADGRITAVYPDMPGTVHRLRIFARLAAWNWTRMFPRCGPHRVEEVPDAR